MCHLYLPGCPLFLLDRCCLSPIRCLLFHLCRCCLPPIWCPLPRSSHLQLHIRPQKTHSPFYSTPTNQRCQSGVLQTKSSPHQTLHFYGTIHIRLLIPPKIQSAQRPHGKCRKPGLYFLSPVRHKAAESGV